MMIGQRDQERLEKPKFTKEKASDIGTAITPGRAPAEGADEEFESPTHERWAEGTPERDPAEGADF
jgi:hypothetical protein